jgi:uncharacterized membrane protein YccF (DUF307 family)
LALWRRDVGAVVFLFAVVLWFQLEFIYLALVFIISIITINLTSNDGAKVFKYRHNAKP